MVNSGGGASKLMLVLALPAAVLLRRFLVKLELSAAANERLLAAGAIAAVENLLGRPDLSTPLAPPLSGALLWSLGQFASNPRRVIGRLPCAPI
jgi:hypothetical protein